MDRQAEPGLNEEASGYNEGVKRKTVYFTAPGQVEILEETLPEPGAHDVLVETICSAISAGTEMLIYHGRFPRDLEADSVISSLRGGFKYPLAYGYASAGIVQKDRKSCRQLMAAANLFFPFNLILPTMFASLMP